MDMHITYKALSEIYPYSNNPRDNNEKAVNAVMASIQTFGFLNPIVIDNEGVIVAGHTRYAAAQRLGLESVPTVTADDLTEEQVKAFRLVDNKVHEIAVWDMPLLDEAMQDIGDSMNMEMFGFEGDLINVDVPQDTQKEFDMEDFADEQFECECPECGFRFNPKR